MIELIVVGVGLGLLCGGVGLLAYSRGFDDGFWKGYEMGFKTSLDETVESSSALPMFLKDRNPGYCQFCDTVPSTIPPERRCSIHEKVDYDS